MDVKLNVDQVRALWLAREHHAVEIGKGYGRDSRIFHPNVVAAGTWKKLVLAGLLTPHDTGEPWRGQALRVERGRFGWLTAAGREVAEGALSHAEAESARLLGDADEARGRGDVARAERLYERSSEWRDLADELKARWVP